MIPKHIPPGNALLCGIDHFSTGYDCRRTAIRNLIRAGVEESTAMKISGHRTRSMLDRYNIQDEQDIQEAMVRVTEYVSTLPVESQVVSLEAAKTRVS
jgi:hypothetical protein